MPLIAPHGGTLVNRVVSTEALLAAKADAAKLTKVALSAREAGDLEMLAIGAFSPLMGFMGEKDFTRVCREMRLANGTVWPIPVTLSPPDAVTEKVNVGDRVGLTYEGETLATMTVSEKY